MNEEIKIFIEEHKTNRRRDTFVTNRKNEFFNKETLEKAEKNPGKKSKTKSWRKMKEKK